MRRIVVAIVLLALSAAPAAGQVNSSVWVAGGLLYPGPVLRIAPGTPDSGGREEPSHIDDALVLRIGYRTTTPLWRLGAELSAGTTIGAVVAVRRLFRESCGPTCTRTTQRSVEIGSTAIRFASIDAAAPLWRPGRLTLSALVGGRLQLYDFDSKSFSAVYSDEFNDVWGAGAGYGLRADLSAGTPTVGVELRRNHIRLFGAHADNYERQQVDLIVSLRASWAM